MSHRDSSPEGTSNHDDAATRLHVVLARDAHVGVVFRRGPSKQVQLVRWNLVDDTFEPGQWLRGRVYERRTDLSPSGELLVYFAAKWRSAIPTFTAVSRPPFFTALALWEGTGTWGGGGLFANERALALSGPKELAPTVGAVDPRIEVSRIERWSPGAPSEPIWHERLLRAGWTLEAAGREKRTDGPDAESVAREKEPNVWLAYDPPRVYRRERAGKVQRILELRILGIHETNGPWYVLEHRVTKPGGELVLELPRTDWAEWDRNGDLLYALDGRIVRAPAAQLDDRSKHVVLADFTASKFAACDAPEWARTWAGLREPMERRPSARRRG